MFGQVRKNLIEYTLLKVSHDLTAATPVDSPHCSCKLTRVLLKMACIPILIEPVRGPHTPPHGL